MAVISKSEFARRRNVSPGRVSQWITAGQIKGAALVGEGRSAQIDEAIACQQLGQTLDIDQRHSNGLRTDLTPPADVVDASPHPSLPPPGDTVADKIAMQRLELLERQNREKATEEIVRNGLLVDAVAARQQAGKEVAQLIVRFEGTLGELATGISAQFKLPQRDVLHYLRTRWREIRASASIEARERAEPMPETVGFDLGDA